jgi:hypothetical protein
MSRADDGLRSEALRAALQEALQGRSGVLEDLLARSGGLPAPMPNLKLAAAFGVEIGRSAGPVADLLARLAAVDVGVESPKAFLPVAAGFGWAHRLRGGRDVALAWSALHALSADSRSCVRVGMLEALIELSLREGAADALVEQAAIWIEDEDEDRELCFGSAALVIEVLGDSRVLTIVREHEPLLQYLSRVIDKVASASRAASRSEGRRRVLMSLGGTLASVVALLRSGERGFAWFQAESERATHPDVRATLSQALRRLSSVAHAPSASVVERLRQSLEGSAKPIRDAARVRLKAGTGRGRRSRPTR